MMTWIASYRFTLLLVASLGLILAPLIFGPSAQQPEVSGLFLLIVLLFSVLAMAEQRRILFAGIVLALPAFFVQISSFVYGVESQAKLRTAAFAAFLAFTAVIIVRDVLRARAVTWDIIQGSVCAYLLIGVTWALVYSWVVMLDPQAFRGLDPQMAGDAVDPMIYYSFVTLTTLGYGDIVPLSHTARTLAWLEAAFGQIYLVILVARLVSLHLTQASRD